MYGMADDEIGEWGILDEISDPSTFDAGHQRLWEFDAFDPQRASAPYGVMLEEDRCQYPSFSTVVGIILHLHPAELWLIFKQETTDRDSVLIALVACLQKCFELVSAILRHVSKELQRAEIGDKLGHNGLRWIAVVLWLPLGAQSLCDLLLVELGISPGSYGRHHPGDHGDDIGGRWR